MKRTTAPSEVGFLPLQAAVDLQDHLMAATNDLDRLQTLLADACTVLFAGFQGASEQIQKISAGQAMGEGEAQRAMHCLGTSVTALQFQDMASQLIQHTHRRLRSCADTLARETFGNDDGDSTAMEPAPLHPNPVTQAEMDAGSIELF